MKLVQMQRALFSQYDWYWEGKVCRPKCDRKTEARINAWHVWKYRSKR